MADTTHAQGDARPYLLRVLTKRYTVIVFILAIITAVELGIAGALEGTPTGIMLLAVLSLIKLVLVAMYYMHLYGDNPFFTGVFLVPIPFVALIVIALLIQFNVITF